MPSKILEAVYRGRQEELTALLAADPTLTIFEAAAVGVAPRVRELVDAGSELLRQRSDDGWTALHLAAHFGRVEVENLLLARGADVDARSDNAMGNCALHAAVAELLLAHGADPAVRTDEGETVEAIATRHGHAELARRLRGEMP
jgi:uncharacterized protein